MRKTNNKPRTARKLDLALAVCLLLTFASFSEAQDMSRQQSSAPIKMEMKPTNCEFHIAVLDAANDQAGVEGLVIVIARLGDGERRQQLNRRRLHNVRTYLVEFKHRSQHTIVTAQGEHVNGYGRIEIYVGGKLFYVLMIKTSADLAVGSCSYEGEDPCSHDREKKLYPCLDRNTRKH